VLLTDGVDTASVYQTARTVMRDVSESDAIIYTVRYDTYDDVQKTRREIAPVQFDENDKPYTVETRRVRGEREEDYVEAKEFLRSIAEDTGGRTFTVNSTTNLDKAFGNIANELRKIYTLGYYPSGERVENASFEIKVRIYRPDLTVRSRERVSSR
jgi:Ca-activated chloride channel homolog